MATVEETTLTQQVDAFKTQMAANIPAHMQQAFAADADALVRSRLIDQRLKEGDLAPTFTLPDATGALISLRTLLTDGPVVLTFYRGEWCPFCNMTLRAYQAWLGHIHAHGAQLVAISPQTPDKSLETVEKKHLTFHVLSDVHNRVAHQYRLAFTLTEPVRSVYTAIGSHLPDFNGDETWELPMPGTFIIGTDGRIKRAFVDPDYTKRMEPADIIATLKTLQA